MSNGTHAVTIAGSAGKAQFSGGRASGSLTNYVVRVFQQLIRGEGQIAVPLPRRATINGMPAAMSIAHVNTNSGTIDVSVVAYQWDPQHIYHLVSR